MAKMESESKRLESFSGWPASSPVKPDELAKAGFYYTRDNDEVRCFSCNLHLNNWEKGDDARQEHQEKSPGCSFIKAGWQYIPDQVDIQCKSSLEKDVDIFSPATYSSSKSTILQPVKLYLCRPHIIRDQII